MVAMSVLVDMAYAAGLAVTSPVWAWNLARTGKWRTDWPGRFGRVGPALPPPEPGRPRLLIHSVSVGETNLVRQLVALFEAEAPHVELVISATTNTGVARALQLYAPHHRVVRFPLDFSFAVERMLDAVAPGVVALVENEVWPNFTAACRRRGIGVCVINGRLSERSHRRYRILRPLVRGMYGRLDAVAAQTQAYADRFVDLGVPAPAVSVLDTMKWDTAVIADRVEGSDQLAVELGLDRGRPLIVAGSTGPGEERLLIDTCPPDAQLLLVPRKPERFDEVAALDPAIRRRSRPCPHNPAPRTRLFLLDAMGELRKAYALADVCLVGRSFLGLYGSDVMEPVALGKPTIIGPHHADFADSVAALREGGGLIVSATPGADAAALLADRPRAAELARRGVEVIRARQGATRRHFDMLTRLLSRPNRCTAARGHALDPPATERAGPRPADRHQARDAGAAQPQRRA